MMLAILEIPWTACVLCYKIGKAVYYTYCITTSAYKYFNGTGGRHTKTIKYVTDQPMKVDLVER